MERNGRGPPLKQHEQFDQFAGEWLASYRASGRTIYCREGCAGCCHMAVHATWPEAVALADRLSARQTADLVGYIERLQAALPGLPDLKSYLKGHRQALGPCPFLDSQGACSVYAARPLACRALLSTRPAAWCTVDFACLSQWDRQAYESSLDRQVVAWPTHYVAATQDFGRELERVLLDSMRQAVGWSLSGNFAVMVWLQRKRRLDGEAISKWSQCREILAASNLDHSLLLHCTGSPAETASRLPHRQTSTTS